MLRITENEFNMMRGEVLRIALNVESFLDFAITSYFMGHPLNNSEKRKLLQEMIYDLKFGKKVDLFEKLWIKEKEEKLVKLMKNIKFIHDLRNKVAHDDMRRTDKEIYLVKRDSTSKGENKTYLTKDLMKDINEKWINITTTIIDMVYEQPLNTSGS